MGVPGVTLLNVAGVPGDVLLIVMGVLGVALLIVMGVPGDDLLMVIGVPGTVGADEVDGEELDSVRFLISSPIVSLANFFNVSNGEASDVDEKVVRVVACDDVDDLADLGVAELAAVEAEEGEVITTCWISCLTSWNVSVSWLLAKLKIAVIGCLRVSITCGTTERRT